MRLPFTLAGSATNAAWLFAEKALKGIVGVAVTLWVARHLGASDFGTLSFAIALVTLFSVFQSLGLDRIVIRDLVRDDEHANAIMGTAFALRLAGSIVALALASATALLLYPDNLVVFMLTSIVAIGWLFKSFDVADWLFQAQVRSVYSAISRTLGLLTGSLAQVVLVVMGASVVSFAWAGALELAATALALVIALRLASKYTIEAAFQLQRAKEFLRQSWPLMIAGATVVLQSRIDHVILAQARGDYELGQYALAVRVIEAFIVGASIVVGSVAPSVIKARSGTPQAYQEALLNLYRLVLTISGLSALVLILLPKEVWLLVVGQEYTGAVNLLPLLSIRLIISSLGVAKSVFTVNEGLFRFTMFGYCLGAACGTPLVYVLAPEYGAIGAAIASITSFVISTFLLDAFYQPARANVVLMWRACLPPWRLGHIKDAASAEK